MGNINDSDALIEQKPKPTQLLYAAENGKLELMEELLKDTSIDIDTINSSALTPLFLASKEGHTDCVKTLLSAGARVDGVGDKDTALTPIWVATYSGHEECVNYLIQGGANLNSKFPVTPLYIASREGRSGCLQLLINAGSDLEVRNSNLETPFLVACKGLHQHCVELLLSAGCDMNVIDRHGHTPLYYVCSYATPDGHKLIEILLNAGADVNEVCEQKTSFTPLHVCATQNKVQSTKFLLLYGADNKLKDSNGHTPKDLAEPFSQCHELLKLYQGYVPMLKQLCCSSIRKCLGSKRLCKIPELPTPRILQHYLSDHELWDSVL